MKKILIALVALLSIGFIKHSEAATGLLIIKESASFFTINKVLKHVASPSCGVNGCEYPGKHDEKHENQKSPRPFLWDAGQERYREATKAETASINSKTDVDFPDLPEEEIADLEEELEEEIIEEEEEEEEISEEDEMDDFFGDSSDDLEDEETDAAETEEDDEIYDDEEDEIEITDDEDDYFDEDEEIDSKGNEDTDTSKKEDEETYDDLDISDWGIKLKEKLNKEIEKVEREVDREIEKLSKKRKRKSSRNTPSKNKDL